MGGTIAITIAIPQAHAVHTQLKLQTGAHESQILAIGTKASQKLSAPIFQQLARLPEIGTRTAIPCLVNFICVFPCQAQFQQDDCSPAVKRKCSEAALQFNNANSSRKPVNA
jgi:hypothetical protein